MKIQNEADFDAAVAAFRALWKTSLEGDTDAEWDRLLDLIEAYDKAHHAVPAPTREEAAAYRREQEEA